MKQILRKNDKSVERILTVLILLLLGSGSLSLIKLEPLKNQENDLNIRTSYIPSSPIIITSDSGFSGFPGDGSENNPFRIENYEIITNQQYAIHITDTTKYFVIKNCFIKSSNWQDDYRGISIEN